MGPRLRLLEPDLSVWAMGPAVLPGQRHPLPCPGPSCIPRSLCPAHGHPHMLAQKSPSHTTRHPRQNGSPQLPGHLRRQAPVPPKPARAHSSRPGSHMELLDLTPCPGTVGLALCTRSTWSSVAPAEFQRPQGPEWVQAVCGLSGERGSAQIGRQGSLSRPLCQSVLAWSPVAQLPGVDPWGGGQGDMGGALAPRPGRGALAAPLGQGGLSPGWKVCPWPGRGAGTGGPRGHRALRVSVAPPQRHLHPHCRGCRDDVRRVSGLLRGHPGVPVPTGDGKARGRAGAGRGCRGRTQSSGGSLCSGQMGPCLAVWPGSRDSPGGLGTFPGMTALWSPCVAQKPHPVLLL